MKTTMKLALAAVALAAATQGYAQQYANGDLLIGFGGGATDFIFDLGQIGALHNGQSWVIGSGLGTQFGVIGAYTAGTRASIFASSNDSTENSFDPTGAYAAARTGIATIAGGTSAISPGGSRTPLPTDATSWTYQTITVQPGNTFQNNFFNPNVPAGGLAYFFDNNNNGTVTTLGQFSYVGDTLTFAAVPEPSAVSLIGGFGVIMLVFRRWSACRA